jgi:hypothetical protein
VLDLFAAFELAAITTTFTFTLAGGLSDSCH